MSIEFATIHGESGSLPGKHAAATRARAGQTDRATHTRTKGRGRTHAAATATRYARMAPRVAHVATARPQATAARSMRLEPPVARSRMRQETRRHSADEAPAHIVRNKVRAAERRRARLREAGPLVLYGPPSRDSYEIRGVTDTGVARIGSVGLVAGGVVTKRAPPSLLGASGALRGAGGVAEGGEENAPLTPRWGGWDESPTCPFWLTCVGSARFESSLFGEVGRCFAL